MRLSDTALFSRLLQKLPFSEFELVTLILTAPSRYKEHYIEKRNGRGMRLISQPTAELKALQRLLVKSELSNLKIHDSATAYRHSKSIYQHALPHVNNHFLLKLDFKDFFPSLTDFALKHKLKLDTKYTDLEIDILCKVLLKNNRKSSMQNLSIGAPSSPFISNYLMYEFDQSISDYCAVNNMTYTRYADDIAISANEPFVLDKAKGFVDKTILKLSYLGLTLNQEKTVNVSRKYKRQLVGLTLGNNGKVSLGRDEKRRLRASVDALYHGRLDAIETSKLKGRLAFSISIDYDFVINLCRKYGFSSVNELTQKG